jgi:hypothetical protein
MTIHQRTSILTSRKVLSETISFSDPGHKDYAILELSWGVSDGMKDCTFVSWSTGTVSTQFPQLKHENCGQSMFFFSTVSNACENLLYGNK